MHQPELCGETACCLTEVFPSLDVNHSFVHCILPASHLVPAQLSDQLLSYHHTCVHITLVLLRKGPKMQESQCWQFRYAKEKPWSASFKWKAESSWLSEERKISHAKVDKICSKNESSVCETVKKEKEIHTSFAVASQTVKFLATGHEKSFS